MFSTRSLSLKGEKSTLFLFLFLNIIISSACYAQSSVKKHRAKSIPLQKSLKRFQDSLDNNLVQDLEVLQSYDEAIALLREKKISTKPQMLTFNRLSRKREQLKFGLDSLKLAIANSYRRNGLTEKAEMLLNELAASKYGEVRKGATLSLDSLMHEKRVLPIEEYPLEPITKLLKPILPVAGIFFVVFLLRFLYICFTYKNHIAIECNDEAEKKAFRLAWKTMLEEFQTRPTQNVHFGPASSILPHIIPDLPVIFESVVAINIPDSYFRQFGLLWQLGLKKKHQLEINIEKAAGKVFIKAVLKKNKIMVDKWDLSIIEENLFNKRMDIAYQALLHIQLNP